MKRIIPFVKNSGKRCALCVCVFVCVCVCLCVCVFPEALVGRALEVAVSVSLFAFAPFKIFPALQHWGRTRYRLLLPAIPSSASRARPGGSWGKVPSSGPALSWRRLDSSSLLRLCFVWPREQAWKGYCWTRDRPVSCPPELRWAPITSLQQSCRVFLFTAGEGVGSSSREPNRILK